MRNLHSMLEGTALPRIDREAMERMFARDSLSLLGLD
jgi:hypothetical protein